MRKEETVIYWIPTEAFFYLMGAVVAPSSSYEPEEDFFGVRVAPNVIALGGFDQERVMSRAYHKTD